MKPDTASGVLACTHCGSTEEQPAVVRYIEVGEATATSCPSCAATLARGRLHGHPLLVCQRCHGLLIEMIHFVSVIDAARAHEDRRGIVLPRQQNPGDREVACPLCGRRMMSHIYGGPGNLVIETCETCHVNWLDPGELGRIARAR